MINNRSQIFAATGKISLGEYKGCTLSVLPFGEELHIIESAGLKYAYPEKLRYGECRGISNVALENKAYLSVEGCALIIVNGGAFNDDNLYQTARADKVCVEKSVPQMIYADMHCDTLTACRDGGCELRSCGLQTDLLKLKKSGCAAQCFAIFTQGQNAAARFFDYLKFYKASLKDNSDLILPALNSSDLARCKREGKTAAILTVENLGFIGGDPEKIRALYREGVRMASLVWNEENALAYPNLIFKDGVPEFEKREKRGLKTAGREAVEILDELKIIVDISHLSDGGAEEILKGRKIPLVASHSNAAAICPVSRNLTDRRIKMIADCGGIIGVNFCADFLGGDTYEKILANIKHITKVGGEDVVAFGGDLDGIPPAPQMEDCAKMPRLIEYISSREVCGGALDKLLYKNFERVFCEICG